MFSSRERHCAAQRWPGSGPCRFRGHDAPARGGKRYSAETRGAFSMTTRRSRRFGRCTQAMALFRRLPREKARALIGDSEIQHAERRVPISRIGQRPTSGAMPREMRDEVLRILRKTAWKTRWSTSAARWPFSGAAMVGIQHPEPQHGNSNWRLRWRAARWSHPRLRAVLRCGRRSLPPHSRPAYRSPRLSKPAQRDADGAECHGTGRASTARLCSRRGGRPRIAEAHGQGWCSLRADWACLLGSLRGAFTLMKRQRAARSLEMTRMR